MLNVLGLINCQYNTINLDGVISVLANQKRERVERADVWLSSIVEEL